jgi:anthranilate phosphoribosyltransferase
MIEEAILVLTQGKDLEPLQMETAMRQIMSGSCPTPEIVEFLKLLNKKGESVEELTAAVSVMRRFAIRINSKHKVILDTCGTGGDKKGTFNISTAVAFVVSGLGIAVAKHGNRSVSSHCGSADILEALGVNINLDKEGMERCLDEAGIAFLFAPTLHPAMKYAMEARREIKEKTIFNILGPLSNPAAATHQLVGVFDKKRAGILARVLSKLGTVHSLVVHGDDGLDEITIAGKTYISEAKDGKVTDYEIDAVDFGFKRVNPEELKGGSIDDNVKILLGVLQGDTGPARDIVVLNAAAAIYAADRAESLKEGVKLAARAIDSGDAMAKLEMLRKYSKKG